MRCCGGCLLGFFWLGGLVFRSLGSFVVGFGGCIGVLEVYFGFEVGEVGSGV